jgi:hypothetical protein
LGTLDGRKEKRNGEHEHTVENIEKELAKSGWDPMPEYFDSIAIEELLAGTEDASQATDADLRKRIERRGTTPSQVVKKARRKKTGIPGGVATLLMMGLVSLLGHLASTFRAYDCTNRSNIVELYSLLKPDACAAIDSN